MRRRSRCQLPLGVMQVFLSCWIRLYGLVCMEIFGHLKFALADAEPMFEAELHSLGWVPSVPSSRAERRSRRHAEPSPGSARTARPDGRDEPHC